MFHVKHPAKHPARERGMVLMESVGPRIQFTSPACGGESRRLLAAVGELPAKQHPLPMWHPPPQPFRASIARLDPPSRRGSALPLLLPLNLDSSRFGEGVRDNLYLYVCVSRET